MPPKKMPLWAYFVEGEKQNSSHSKAFCKGCLNQHKPALPNVIDVDAAGDSDAAGSGSMGDGWMAQAMTQITSVRGVRASMAAHLVSCPFASAAAKKAAQSAREDKKRNRNGSDSEDETTPPVKKHATFVAVDKVMKQSELTVFKGIDIPFNSTQKELVQKQFLRATISANLPFAWTVNPDIIKLFIMFRSRATDVMPSDAVLSGRLLDESASNVEKQLKKDLHGQYVTMGSDGWKDGYTVTGVTAAAQGKVHLVDLIHQRGKKKDGDAMCEAFCGHIDKLEATTDCTVVGYVCDNDGGSQNGRKKLVILRPWVLATACCSHQGQLILIDYLKENPEAQKTAEESSALVGWINNHERVRDIFDDVQTGGDPEKTPLAYLSGNLTRWTTHSIAFNRLIRLRAPLREAAVARDKLIIDAQVGAEKNKKKIAAMTKEAKQFIALLDDPRFWKRLQKLAEDIEPITFITNINQGDSTRADQVLLGFAGVFLHFKKHKIPSVAKGMMQRLEKRWAAMDQDFFVMALVLNPYEKLSRFGNDAGIDVFVLEGILLNLYKRVNSRPPVQPLTDAEQEDKERKEAAVSAAFLNYMSGTGPFASFEESRERFQNVHGDDPILVWRQFLNSTDVSDLADFAILLLGIVINQGGVERVFSDMKIKRTRLRNRLTFKKTEKMSKVGAVIRAENMAAGLTTAREPRKNHDDSRVAELIAVPKYADILENEDPADDNTAERVSSRLVNSRAAWRKLFTSWAVSARQEEMEAEEDEEESAMTVPHTASRKKWLPRSLSLLFGGKIQKEPETRRPRKAFNREELLMELLAAEHSDEEPDDGELEGSGDDYDGDSE
ncbi:ribonuclease H-like domain-containing protein [Mycena pura]|uniref:Ribonuclease H-like domain-containing protein n=1 Tax=Mycena pura TaxID=153505 RepID=A0AAD6VDJ4_9AGAR|nr:ribonuclease H-like domain-containing protein [Mycena pura]